MSFRDYTVFSQKNGPVRALRAGLSGGLSEIFRLFSAGGQVPDQQPILAGEQGVEVTYDPSTGQFGMVGAGGPQVAQTNPGTVVIPNNIIEAAVRADPAMLQRILAPQPDQQPQPGMAAVNGQPMPSMAGGGTVPAIDVNALYKSLGGAQSGFTPPASNPWYNQVSSWGQSPNGQNALRMVSNFGAAMAPNNQVAQGMNDMTQQNYQSGAFGRQMNQNLGAGASALETNPMGGSQPGGKTGVASSQLGQMQVKPDLSRALNPRRSFSQGGARNAGGAPVMGLPAMSYQAIPGLSPQDQVAAINAGLNMRQQSMLEQQMMSEQQAAMAKANQPWVPGPFTLSSGQNRYLTNPVTGQRSVISGPEASPASPKFDRVLDAQNNYQWITPGETGSIPVGVQGYRQPVAQTAGGIKPEQMNMIDKTLSQMFLNEAMGNTENDYARLRSPLGGTDTAAVRANLSPERQRAFDEARNILAQKVLAGESITEAVRQIQAEYARKRPVNPLTTLGTVQQDAAKKTTPPYENYDIYR